MKLKLYQVDAFASKVFAGNPAAVCPLQHWLQDDILQKIAMENNLAETVFYVKQEQGYAIRWFTPATEVDLCGHATLAAAYVLFHHEGYSTDLIQFHSLRSGRLTVHKKGEWLALNFPSDTFESVALSPTLTNCFDIPAMAAYKGKTDFMLVFDNEETIQLLKPKFDKIAALPCRGLIVTAKGNQSDFVSRFFAPQIAVDEDPVTGSAHTTLIPYWAERLGKKHMQAMQLSKRQGFLQCEYLGERVEIGGQAKLFLEGFIYLE